MVSVAARSLSIKTIHFNSDHSFVTAFALHDALVFLPSYGWPVSSPVCWAAAILLARS